MHRQYTKPQYEVLSLLLVDKRSSNGYGHMDLYKR